MEEEYEIDDDFDINIDDDTYLEDDEINLPDDETEEIDDDYVYAQLSKRNSPLKNRYTSSFTDDIVANESGGNYKAVNPNSSAAGKYQFLWNTWKDKIKKVTGVNSKQEFLNNPDAQDNFYNDYYVPNELMPAVTRLKKRGVNMSTEQLAKLVHFRGEQGASDYLQGKIGDKPEAYNSSISKYIGKGQVGYMNSKPITPLATNFKMPNINPYVSPEISEDNNGIDIMGGITKLGNATNNIYDSVNQYKGKIAQGMSTAIDTAEQFTSAQEQGKQYRKMMQQLYGDNPANYAPVTQRVNNNPILI